MTSWDVLDSIIKTLPPLVATILVIVATVVFLVGFNRHGINFLKFGSRQQETSDLSKKIDGLSTEVNTKIDSLSTEVSTKIDSLTTEIDDFRTELGLIKTNHFGHLKNYLGILNGVLLDKNIIDNETKARLDNELRDM